MRGRNRGNRRKMNCNITRLVFKILKLLVLLLLNKTEPKMI